MMTKSQNVPLLLLRVFQEAQRTKMNTPGMFDVVVTSYEMVIRVSHSVRIRSGLLSLYLVICAAHLVCECVEGNMPISPSCTTPKHSDVDFWCFPCSET